MTRLRSMMPQVLCIGGLLLSVGCYHATIKTERHPSAETMIIWAHSWIYGLVPPAVVKAQNECENGVARVETERTFVNGLVGALTLGIYTPMKIVVTCAALGKADADLDSSSVLTIPYDSDYAQIMDAFGKASDMAVAREEPVYVKFESDNL